MAGSLRSERILNINDELARVQINNKQVARYLPGGGIIYLFIYFESLFCLKNTWTLYGTSFIYKLCVFVGPQKDKRGHSRVSVRRLYHLGAIA